MTKPFSFWNFLCKEEGHLNFYSKNKNLWFTCQRCGKNLDMQESLFSELLFKIGG